MAKKIVSSSGGRSYTTAVEISIKEFIDSFGKDRMDYLSAVNNGYFSAKMFAEKTGYSFSRACAILSREAKDKNLSLVYVKETGGNIVKYYRPIKKKKK